MNNVPVNVTLSHQILTFKVHPKYIRNETLTCYMESGVHRENYFQKLCVKGGESSKKQLRFNNDTERFINFSI